MVSLVESLQRIGKYEILGKLGSGGMAEVFLARTSGAAGFEKKVALKRLAANAVDDELLTRSLINEARLVAQLSHPNLVQVFEFEQVDRAYCMAMEYVDGVTLDDMLARCRDLDIPMPRGLIVFMAMEVCAGLDYAHSATADDGSPLGLVHRDIKPSNIMISRQGQVKIMDFGIAKSSSNPYKTTRSGGVKGTLSYMSPEQLSGAEPLLATSDLFSLGIILYEAATLDWLFPDANLLSLAVAIQKGLREEAREQLQSWFPELVPIVEKLLQMDPEQRYPDARTLLRALRPLSFGSTALEMSEFLHDLDLDAATSALNTAASSSRQISSGRTAIADSSHVGHAAGPESLAGRGGSPDSGSVAPTHDSGGARSKYSAAHTSPYAAGTGSSEEGAARGGDGVSPHRATELTADRMSSSGVYDEGTVPAGQGRIGKGHLVAVALGSAVVVALLLFVFLKLGSESGGIRGGGEGPGDKASQATAQKSEGSGEGAKAGDSGGETASGGGTGNGSAEGSSGAGQAGAESSEQEAAESGRVGGNAAPEDKGKQGESASGQSAPASRGTASGGSRKPIAKTGRSSRAGSGTHKRGRHHAAAVPNPKKDTPPPEVGEGLLIINVQPWAELQLDGKSRGTTPFREKVSAGRHKVKLANGGAVKEFTVEVDKDSKVLRVWTLEDNQFVPMNYE